MLKKVLLFLSFVLLLVSCGDNPAKIPEDELSFTVSVSRVVDSQGQVVISPSELVDLCLWSVTAEERIPCITWSTYEKMTAARVPIKSIDASSEKLELTATSNGKAYKGFIDTPDISQIESPYTFTFELKQVYQNPESDSDINNPNDDNEGGGIIPSAKCQLDISVSIPLQNDLNVIYTKSNYSVEFSLPDLSPEEIKNISWLVDSEEVESGTDKFVFIPKSFDGETYTISVLNKSNIYQSATVFIKSVIPNDFAISSQNFYETIQLIPETKESYFISFTDADPDFDAIAQTLTSFDSINFYLDFTNCTELTNFPDKLKNKENLCGLKFGNRGITFENSSFLYLNNLEYLILDGGNNTFDGVVGFFNENLRFVSIGNGNNTFKQYTFPGKSIKYFMLGDGDNTFCESAFTTSNTESPVEHELIISAGEGNLEFLSRCSNLKTLYKERGSITLGSIYSTVLDTIVVKDCVCDIYVSAFNSSALKNFYFSDGTKNIQARAFYNSKVRKLNLKNGNVTVGGSAFEHMENLVSFEMGDGDYTEEEGTVFYNNPQLETIKFGNGKHVFGPSSMHCCPKLKTFEAGDGDIVFENSGFIQDKALETVTIGKGDVAFVNSTFIECKNLKRVDAEDGISYIGPNVFNGCESLEEIRLNKNCTEIGQYAFKNCTNITFVVDPDNTAFSTSDDGKCLMNYDKTIIIYPYPEASND